MNVKRTLSQVIAACFSFSAFAVAVVSGVAAEVAPVTILMRAIAVLIVGYLFGLFVGLVCERVVDEHVSAYRAAHPLPGEGEDSSGTTERESTAEGENGQPPPASRAAAA